MKSRNIKAIFATVLTVALLATAMTGFAADVSTTTTYNTEDGKIAVTTNVTNATADSEVTYLVKSGDAIVYIDQETAVNGAVSFEYKIAKGKMSGYSSNVTFGTSAEDTFTGEGSADLGIVALANQSGENYTVTYADDAVAAGIGETVTANITPADNYEIADVLVNGVSMGPVASVTVDNDDVITVEVNEKTIAPAISVYKVLDGTTFTAVIAPQGDVTEFGVEYALFAGVTKQYKSAVADEMAAVQLILPEGTVATEDDFVPYFVANDEVSYDFTAMN